MTSQMKIELNQIWGTPSEAPLRTHRVLIARPSEKGGGDVGPMGAELFLAAVGGCFMSNVLAAIRAREANVSSVRAEVIGTIVDSPSRFAAIELYITADCQSGEVWNGSWK